MPTPDRVDGAGAGRAPERPEGSEEDVRTLAPRFLRSSSAVGVDGADQRELLETVLWFGTDDGPGDPMRWSPVNVDILLADRVPRTIVAVPAFLSLLPDLLRAFIRFGHHERGFRGSLTADTLAAVDQWEPDYRRIIRSARPQGPSALLAALPFPAPRIADDIRPVVREMLDACHSVADQVLDVEHRTAMRRLLSRAAAGDPILFRRKASPCVVPQRSPG